MRRLARGVVCVWVSLCVHCASEVCVCGLCLCVRVHVCVRVCA